MERDEHNKEPDRPKFSSLYYFFQVLLAITGIVIGFWIGILLYPHGKLDLGFCLILMGLPLLLVNIHRIITIKNMNKKR